MLHNHAPRIVSGFVPAQLPVDVGRAAGPNPAAVAGILSACAERHGVPGAQLALHGAGRTVLAEYGEAEAGAGRPVTGTTAFPVGSITKAITAAAVLALVADGDLELDEPVGLHVRGLTGAAGDITLRQLLSHTGGLPCGPAVDGETGRSVRRYLAQAARPELMVLTPGAGFSYSNVGYVMLGEVVAETTGMSWADAVSAIVLKPLGVAAALIGDAGPQAADRTVATGHSRHPRTGRIRAVRQSLHAAEAAAGALALSAADLVAFGRLHLAGGVPGVLPAVLATQMRTVVPDAVPFGLARGWGLGLATFGAPPREWWGHDGNADGTSCHLRIDPTDGWVVALTSNTGTGTAFWSELTAELRGIGVPLDDALPPEAYPAALAECVGTYRNGDLPYEVTPGGAYGLQLSIDGEPAEPLVVGADLTFYLRDASSSRWTLGGRFVRDHREHLVNAIQIGGRLGSRCFTALI